MLNYMHVQIFKPENFQKGRKLIKKHFCRRPEYIFLLRQKSGAIFFATRISFWISFDYKIGSYFRFSLIQESNSSVFAALVTTQQVGFSTDGTIIVQLYTVTLYRYLTIL